MIRKTTILLVANHSLLSDVLEKLLTSNSRLRLYRAVACNYREILAGIFAQGPVTMVVEREEFGERIGELASLLLEYDDLQIIIISAVNNDIRVYASYQATLTVADDLLALITPATPRVIETRYRQTAVYPFLAHATLHR